MSQADVNFELNVGGRASRRQFLVF